MITKLLSPALFVGLACFFWTAPAHRAPRPTPGKQPEARPNRHRPADCATPVYEVYAIRYASIPDFPVNALVAGADPHASSTSP